MKPVKIITSKDLLKSVTEYANKNHDGHLTILKFSCSTKAWKAVYGTCNVLFSYAHLLKVPGHKTMNDALLWLLKNPTILDEDNENCHV